MHGQGPATTSTGWGRQISLPPSPNTCPCICFVHLPPNAWPIGRAPSFPLSPRKTASPSIHHRPGFEVAEAPRKIRPVIPTRSRLAIGPASCQLVRARSVTAARIITGRPQLPSPEHESRTSSCLADHYSIPFLDLAPVFSWQSPRIQSFLLQYPGPGNSCSPGLISPTQDSHSQTLTLLSH